MHSATLKKLAALMLALSVASCIGDPRVAVAPIDSTLMATIEPAYQADGAIVTFHVRTEREYAYAGNWIDFRASGTGRSRKLAFHHVVDPGGARATVVGPATATVRMGRLPSGTYRLTLFIRGQRRETNLIVSPTLVTVDPASLDVIDFTVVGPANGGSR